MSNFCQRMRRDHQRAVVSSCHRPNCDLRLGSWAPRGHIILDLDRLIAEREAFRQEGPIADFLVAFVAGGLQLVVVEMKSRHLGHKPARQLSGTMLLLRKLLAGERFWDLRLVLLHRGIRGIERDWLRRTKVEFQGREYSIILKPCGVSIAEVLSLP